MSDEPADPNPIDPGPGPKGFRVCIRPDCTQLPRDRSASCAYHLEGNVPIGHLIADLEAASALLRRATDTIIAYETEPPSWADEDGDPESGILADIGAFLARVRG